MGRQLGGFLLPEGVLSSKFTILLSCLQSCLYFAARASCPAYKPTKEKFYGETTVMADYKPNLGVIRDPSFKPPPKFHKSEHPFTSETIYMDTYKPWPKGVARPPNCVLQDNYTRPLVKLDDSTSYKVQNIMNYVISNFVV